MTGEVQLFQLPESTLHWKWSGPTPPEPAKSNVALCFPVMTNSPVIVVLGGATTLVNLAVTDLVAVIVTLHVPLPPQGPDQPANVDPGDALASSVTVVPA